MRRVAVGRAEDRADACRVEAVFKIMFLQLIGRGDRNGAQLVQAENRKPELIMAFEHEHDAVAAPDAERFEIVRTLRGCALHVLKRQASFVFIPVDVEHGEFFRFPVGQRVHYIVSKIKFFFVFKINF